MSKITPSAIKAKVEELNASIVQQKQELFKLAKEHFNTLAQELFDKHPDLKQFSWEQYTPYFNDGDVCSFGVYADEPLINGHRPYENSGDEELGINFYTGQRETLSEYNQETRKWDQRRNPNYNPYHATVIDEIGSFIWAFGQEVLQDMFGEGRIIVTPGNVEVEDCDHD